jgi:O-antigen/teichoic acid export membrane protein
MLARLLDIENFGIYSMTWMIVLLFNNFQSSLIISPMMSIGPKKETYLEECQYYVSMLIYQIFYSILNSLIIISVGSFIYYLSLIPWLKINLVFELALVTTLSQMVDYFRRYYFTISRPMIALLIDVLIYLGQILSFLYAIFNKTSVQLGDVFLILTFTYILPIIVGYTLFNRSRIKTTDILSNFKITFNFGKWMAISNITQYIGTQGLIWISGFILSPSSVGGIRAILNLIAPMNLLIQALQNYLPVKTSKIYKKSKKSGVKKYLFNVQLIILVTFMFLTLLSIGYRDNILELLYGPKYSMYSFLLPIFILYVFVNSIIVIISIYFRTIEVTKPLALSSIIATPVSICISVFLIPTFKELGVAINLLAYNIIIITIILFRNNYWGKVREKNV